MKIVGFTVITHMTLKSDQESLKENEIYPLGCSQTILILELLQPGDVNLGNCRNNRHRVKRDLIKTILLFQAPVQWEANCIFWIKHILNQQVKIQQSTPFTWHPAVSAYLLWFLSLIWQGEEGTCLSPALEGPGFQRDPQGFVISITQSFINCMYKTDKPQIAKLTKSQGLKTTSIYIFFF